MKFLVRLFIAGLILYIGLQLGLFEMLIYLLAQVGSVVIALAKEAPIPTAIGVLILILMAGKRTLDADEDL